ncbi:MAG TPA: hypothetical protein VMW56_04600 [Candidatus Margulisiibacteriota bacterium]|nr:hypothetical protein [Candidatus Margulisiibacteriota bacterium]
MKRNCRTIHFALLLLILSVGTAEGFNAETHEQINATCTERSSLPVLLVGEVGIADGINHPFAGKAAEQWVINGGSFEDDDGRFLNHFHNPLTGAGLYGAEPSSIVWMQQDGQGWSWPEARRFYYAALTAQTQGARDQAWADTLRATGQIMHLVEDAGQPAHVRDDAHPMDYVCHKYLFGLSCFPNFEYWVSDNSGQVPLTGSPAVQSILLGEPSGWPAAPAPVANLIDNTIYRGADPNVTVGGLDPGDGHEVETAPVGIAEFTNANFFSEDTAGLYPHPDINLLVESTAVVSNNLLRHYLKKGYRDGLPLDPALVESVFGRALRGVPGLATFYAVSLAGQDGEVWRAEAQTLLPKATAYAQAALDYFFRGKLDFAPDPDDLNGFLIKNLGEEDLNGTFELYYDDAEGNRRLVPGSNSWRRAIPAAQHCANGGPCNQASVPAFDASFDPPPSGMYALVFQGTMGNEAPSNGSLGAVAGKVMQGDSFLLLTAQASYRSTILDRGWHRIGSGLPVPVDYDGSSRICLNGCQGVAINSSTVIFDWLGDADMFGDASACTNSPFYWDGLNTTLLSTDGGRTFTDRSAPIYSQYAVRPFAMIYLGEKRLLAQYYSQTCWSDWFYCPWPGYPNVSECVSCSYFDPNFRYGEECRYDYSLPSGTMYSDDLGATWQLQPGAGLAGYFIGDHTVIAGLPARSVDDGFTWTTIDVTIDDQPMPNLYIYGLAWNRKGGNDRVLLALAWPDDSDDSTLALLKSNDGVHWRLLQSFAQTLGPSYIEQPESIAMGPDGSALMTAWMYDYYYPSSGHYVIYASPDAGETWQPAAAPKDLPIAAASMAVTYAGGDPPVN